MLIFVLIVKSSNRKEANTIEENENTIEESENTIKENENTIEENENTIEENENTIEESENSENTIEENEKTIEENENAIEENENTIEEDENTYEVNDESIANDDDKEVDGDGLLLGLSFEDFEYNKDLSKAKSKPQIIASCLSEKTRKEYNSASEEVRYLIKKVTNAQNQNLPAVEDNYELIVRRPVQTSFVNSSFSLVEV